MHTLIDLLTTLLPLAYGLSAANYQVYFVRRDPFAERTCTPFLLVTAVVHGLYLVARVFYFARPPIVGMGEALGVIALALAGVYLYVEKLQRNKFTGAFILPLVVLLQLVASALMPHGQTAPSSELLKAPLFGVHAVIAMLGYSSFFLGAVYGVMYLLLYRALKQKKFGLIFDRLPSLDTLANMGFWATFVGWVALTVTIGLGIVMFLDLVPGFYRDLKFISTCAVWVVYGGCVVAHFRFGWRGTRLVYLSLVGFAFAILTMVGSNFLWNSFHSFQA